MLLVFAFRPARSKLTFAGEGIQVNSPTGCLWRFPNIFATNIDLYRKRGRHRNESAGMRPQLRKLGNSVISTCYGTFEKKRGKNLLKVLGPIMFLANCLFRQVGLFFTTVGKAIVAFEHAGMLDPVTQQFGRLFTSLRENRSAYYRRSEKLNSDFLKDLVKQFLGEQLYASTEMTSILKHRTGES